MELTYAHRLPRLRLRSLRSGVGWGVFLGLPVALACAYVVLTPSVNVLPALTLYNGKRLLQIGLLLVAALCVAGVPRVRAAWLERFLELPRAARWGLGLMLGLGLASASTGPSWGRWR